MDKSNLTEIMFDLLEAVLNAISLGGRFSFECLVTNFLLRDNLWRNIYGCCVRPSELLIPKPLIRSRCN
jgi:hypothetical protein